jgi:hypothetical protein
MLKSTKRKNLKPPGKCIFCGGSGMSREHIWPEWMQNYFPAAGPDARSAHIVNTLGQSNSFEHGRLHRSHDILYQKLRIACRQCNNGWMSQIVEAAKHILVPLLRGEWPVLNADGASKLAAWITLFTMVIEFADPKTAAVTAEERATFKRTKSPLPNWNVYCGRYSGRQDRVAFWHRGGLILKDGEVPNGVLKPNVQTTTFVIGGAIFHAASGPDFFNCFEPDYGLGIGMRCVFPNSNVELILKPPATLDQMGYHRAQVFLWEVMGIPTSPAQVAFSLFGMASGVVPINRPRG